METHDPEFIPLNRLEEAEHRPCEVPVVDPRGFVLWVAYDTKEEAEDAVRKQHLSIVAPPILDELKSENATLHKQLADLQEELKRVLALLESTTKTATDLNGYVSTLLKAMGRLV